MTSILHRALHGGAWAPFFAAAFLFSVGAGCGSTGYERAASERYDGEVTFARSAEGRFVLAVEERTMREAGPLPLVRFFIYDTAGDSVMYDRTAGFRGSVRWEDAGRVRVEEIPGIVTQEGPGSERYLIDVRTGERTSLDEASPKSLWYHDRF